MGDLVGSKTRLSAVSIELKLLYLVALCIFNPLLKSQDDPRIFSGYRGREGGGGGGGGIFPHCGVALRCRGGKPFVERAKLWSRLSITEQSVVANLTPGLLTSPHIVAPDLELSVKVGLVS